MQFKRIQDYHFQAGAHISTLQRKYKIGDKNAQVVETALKWRICMYTNKITKEFVLKLKNNKTFINEFY